MKKTLLFMMLSLMGLTMMAKPVDPDRAVLIARNFIAQYVKGADQMTATVVYTHPMPKSKLPAMYVVNVGNTFVIVSADDIAHPVLGYSLSRPWPVQTENGKRANENSTDANVMLPSQVSGYLDDLAAQIESAAGQQGDPDRETASEWRQLLSLNSQLLTTNLPDSVGPLLTTTWDQGLYYNALCPEDVNGPDGHVPTGCVATAMAQIINYWGYPIHGRGTHSYQSDYGTLTVNYDSANYDYANMPNVLTDTSNPAQVNAVAKLMYDCGVAVSMNYGSYESGADGTVIASALVDFFRMNPKLGETNSTYYLGEQWYDLIRDNISSNRPVLYSNGSHEYILDGYNYEGYFHFNMGWGGDADGWYLLDTNYSYTAIVDIYPDSSSNIVIGQSYGKSLYSVDSVIHFKHVYAENDFYHDVYTGGAHPQIVTFQLQDTSERIVIDLLSYDYDLPFLEMMFFDGGDTSSQLLRYLNNGGDYLTPIVASGNQITIYYTCVHADAGFHLRIGKHGNCRVVSNVLVNESSNVKEISWMENGMATQWEVEYGIVGFAEGAGISIIVDTSYVMINGLSSDTTYEVRVRPICTENIPDLWKTVTLNKRKYWTDVVFSEPSGYIVDSMGTIHISSAEGLAWLALQRTEDWAGYEYSRKKIVFENDIDLGLYLWRPIHLWMGNVDGQGHVIHNITVKEVSNYYDGGLFGWIEGDTVKNLGFTNANIDSPNAGPLAASTSDNMVLLNCYSINHNVKSSQFSAGGLLGACSSTIINCFAIGNVYPAFDGGGIIANGGPKMYNCYSSLRGISGTNVWKGLISGYTVGGLFENCFADIDYVEDTWSGAYLGTLYDNPTMGYFFGHTEDIRSVTNVSAFTKNDEEAVLAIDTSVNCTFLSGTTLINALNCWVVDYNSSSLRMWEWDSILNLPVLGDYYETTCPNVSEITLKNIKIQEGYGVAISWQENGMAESWQIKCVPYDDTVLNVVMFTSSSNSDTLYGLHLGSEYLIYVRPLCTTDSIERWGTPVDFIVDKPYWTDIVKTQPVGYVEDSGGNIMIMSAEGLAWLSVCSNGLNGQPICNYQNKTVKLLADIDMDEYKWKPISLAGDHPDEIFQGSFLGCGHIISNLYVNEKEGSWSALFGSAINAYFYNVAINDFEIIGYYNVGSLIGEAIDCRIDNCHANGTIKGAQNVGGLIGIVKSNGNGGYIINSSARGEVYGNRMTGGLVGFQTLMVQNCYSNCNIHNGIGSKNEWNGGLFGGCSGEASNCYNSGQVDLMIGIYGGLTSAYGIFELYPDVIIKNIYSLLHNNGLSFIGDDEWGSHIVLDTSSIISNGSLITNVTISGNTYSNLLSALNAWVDAYDTAAIYRHWAADSANVNGGYPVFAAIPCTTVTGSDSIVVCDSYTWHGTTYTTSTELIDTLTSLMGCDSIVTHHLIVNHSNTNNETVTACEDYFFGGQWIYSSGQYTDSLTNTAGCDSIVTLTLTVNNPVHTATTEVACDSYTWQGATLTTSGTYTYPHNDANGCTQIDTLHLTINHSNTSIETVTACDSYTWHGTSYSASTNTPTFTETNANGCDSVVTLNLTVNYSNTGIETVTACDAYTWHGTAYATSNNTATFTETNANGCDSVVTLNLTVNYSNTGIETVTACDSYTWHGTAYTASNNTATFTETNANGCDSVVTLNLTVNYSNTGIETVTACDNYTWHGTAYTASNNTATFIETNAAGCDSVVTLNLIVNYGNTGIETVTACDNYTWHGTAYTASNNTATFTETNAAGCDSVVTLNLIVNYGNTSIETVTACDSYTWHGTAYTASNNTATFTETNANGCDSVVTLNLTVNYSNTGIETVTACDNYTWHGNNYTASNNTATFIETNAAGCDSVVTLQLTINQSTAGDTIAVACDAFAWYENFYTASGTHTRYTTNAAGCDSTVTLHLTINSAWCTVTTETACDSYFWYDSTYTTSGTYTYSFVDSNGCSGINTLHLAIVNAVNTAMTETACDTYIWNGTPYTASGNYTYSHLAANGCTQVDTLHLTINYSDAVNEIDTACEDYFFGGEWITVSGQYTDSLTNIAGCDSIVTLNLTVNNPVHEAVTEVACDSYTWQGATITVSGDYTFPHDDANGCTQVDTLHLTVNYSVETAVTDTADDSYSWQGTTYTESGTYQWQGTTAEGCDSTVTLMLVINHVGIGEIDYSKMNIDVYPNPTTGQLTIDAEGILSVEVFDPTGRKVATHERANKIDLTKFPAGTYLLKIHLPSGTSLHRVILK